jgi:hypothetical protein
MKLLSAFLMLLFMCHGIKSHSQTVPGSIRYSNKQDTLKENQILYNGREWQNQYYLVRGDQFLFSNDFLPGSVIIRGKKFMNLNIKYDLYNDEILIPNEVGGTLQLNKELVDSFSLSFRNKTYWFTRMPEDKLKGYVNILYKGKSALYIKYSEYIKKLAVEGMYDKFYPEKRIYFVRNDIVNRLTGKSDMIRLLADQKNQIKDFIKKNKLIIDRDDPETFIPVIRYSDTIR